jgi:hypothetical protein
VIEVPRPVEKGLRDAGLELREGLAARQSDDAESEVVALAPHALPLKERGLEPEVAEQTPELEGVALGAADARGAGVAVEQPIRQDRHPSPGRLLHALAGDGRRPVRG